MLLLLDNHDSFTWNLVELLRTCDKVNVKILTPEQFDPGETEMYDRIIFSPGPGLPDELPAMSVVLDAVEKLNTCGRRSIPVFGVCLGLQAIAIHFGASLYNLPTVVHGQPRKLILIQPGHPLFAGIPSESEVGLYHSWAVEPGSLPSCLETLATTPEGTVMALAHKTLPVWGVQFHPKSIMTPFGKQILHNWLAL